MQTHTTGRKRRLLTTSRLQNDVNQASNVINEAAHDVSQVLQGFRTEEISFDVPSFAEVLGNDAELIPESPNVPRLDDILAEAPVVEVGPNQRRSSNQTGRRGAFRSGNRPTSIASPSTTSNRRHAEVQRPSVRGNIWNRSSGGRPSTSVERPSTSAHPSTSTFGERLIYPSTTAESSGTSAWTRPHFRVANHQSYQ